MLLGTLPLFKILDYLDVFIIIIFLKRHMIFC